MRNLINNTLILLLCCLFSQAVFAQTPQAFNYQGVARDADGSPIANKTIGVLFNIGYETPAGLGSTIYSERHVLTTSDFGLFSAQVGTGTPVSGVFATIDWGAPGNHTLALAIDVTGGTSYTFIGEPTRLVSVPYALHAATCDEIVGGTHWGEYGFLDGVVQNTNQKTIIVSSDNCCQFYNPDLVNATALLVNGIDKKTGGYFTTENLGIESSAVKAEIIGNGSHSDPVAVRGRAIVTDPVLGNGGWGGEFIGGEIGVVCEGQFSGITARSTTGKAGRFEGDVEVLGSMNVSRFLNANAITAQKSGVTPAQISLQKPNTSLTETFSLTAFQSDAKKMDWGYLTASSTGGVTYQALSSLDNAGRMSVGTNDPGTYALRVQQNSNLGFGLTSNGAVNNTWEMWVGGSVVAGKKQLMLYAGNAFVGQFNPSTGAYTMFSDRKFKRDIRPMDQITPQVQKLNFVTYKTEQDATGNRHSGVIAQELEQVFPEFVTVGEDRDGTEVRSVDYAGLSVVALKAIQEQQVQIEKLMKINADLTARIEKLEAKR